MLILNQFLNLYPKQVSIRLDSNINININCLDENTQKTQEHQPCGFCIKVTSPYFKKKESWQQVLYRGNSAEDVLDNFVSSMDMIRDFSLSWIEENGRVEMKPLSPKQEKEYQEAKTCWFCGKGNTFFY